MKELLKASTELVERAKRAAATIPGFEMTKHDDGERDLSFNEYLIINHYENQSEKLIEVMEQEAFKLSGMYYQLRFMLNYFTVLSMQCSKADENALHNLYGLLIRDAGLQNIEEILQAVTNLLNDVTSQLLETEVTIYE